ncbi:MAG: hypothetical protein F6K30_27470 [Cyanothece sp. SIO2G6]|nr:hypothetical protein [Cyanothece sp. SIO2G6]
MNAVASHWFRQLKFSLQQIRQRFGQSNLAHAFLDTRTTVTSVGALLALGIVGTGGYVVTRPCAMGGCPVLEQAKTLYGPADPLLDATASMESISQTYATLLDINYRLAAVPLWSPHHAQAQAVLGGHEEQADVLAQVLAAQQQALNAAIASQSPPYPLEMWQTIAAEWQAAIAQLSAVATEDSVAPLVQVKLEEYEDNLAIVQQRIQRETEAAQVVAVARESLHGADALSSVAQSSDSLQVVESTLQTALAHLATVPGDTMVSAEAEHLLALYQPQLTTVGTRLQSEEQSTQLYARANNSAEQALASEQTNQWSAAVTHWQEALNQIQQIPEGTAYHDQVKPLLASYGSALDQAQHQLDQMNTVVQARQSLTQSCGTVAKVCQSVGPGIDPTASLQVQLTPNYDDVVEQAMLSRELKASPAQHLESLESIHYLLGVIATVGRTNQIAIELHRSDGVQVGTYQPEVSGYIPTQSVPENQTINILSISTVD